MWWQLVVLVICASACQHRGKTFQNNEEWTEKDAFRMICKTEPNGAWRVDVIGCITKDGLMVPVNNSRPDGQYEWHCQATSDGKISLRQEIGKRADCQGGHTHGSDWIDKSFKFRCDEGGVTTFVGCVTNKGVVIPNGQTQEIAGQTVQCTRHANGTVQMMIVPKAENSPCTDSHGVQRAAGDRWIENNFENACRFGVVSVTGCKVDNVDRVLPLNSVWTQGNMEYHCESNDGLLKLYSKVKQ